MHTTLTHELVKARQAELARVRVRHELPARLRRPARLALPGRARRRGRLAHA